MFGKKVDLAGEDLKKLLEHMKKAADGDMSAVEASEFQIRRLRSVIMS